MKRKKLLILLSISTLVILVVFLFQYTDSYTYKIHQIEKKLTFSKENVNYDRLKYEHYDTSSFHKKAQTIEKLLKNSGSEKEIFKLFSELKDSCSYVNTMSLLAEINSNSNVKSKEFSEEYQYSYETSIEMNDTLMKIAKKILGSDYKKKAGNYWSKEELQRYETYLPRTNYQKKLFEKEQELIQKYNKVSSENYTATLNGTCYSEEEVNQLSGELFQNAYKEIMRKKNEKLAPIMLKLISVRNKLSSSYGYDNYSEFCYENYYERSYTARDIQTLSEQIKTYMVPLEQELVRSFDTTSFMALNKKLNSRMKNEKLDVIEYYLSKISPRLVESFAYMRNNQLCNIQYRKNKVAGSYTVYLPYYKVPFLYSQPTDDNMDSLMLIHEFGHFNNYYYSSEKNVQNADIDLAEIHSQGLEMLYLPFYGDAGKLSTSERDLLTRYFMIQRLNNLIEGCLYDEFQRKIYTLENPTVTEINTIFYELSREYGISVDEHASTDKSWVAVQHNFQQPFYYISYTLSGSVSLEIWINSLNDYDVACSQYLKLVSQGFEQSFTDTLVSCELGNPFSDGYYKKLSEELRENLLKEK